MSRTSKCKCLYDEVCCNDSCREWLADYPSEEDCEECPYRENEVVKNDERGISN